MLRFLLSFRLLAVILPVWVLISTQSMAWQQRNYAPYPAYAAPVNYNPYINNRPQPYRYTTPGYPGYNNQRYNYPPFYQQNFQQRNYYGARTKPSSQVATINKPQIKKPIVKQPEKSHLTTANFASKQDFINKLLPHIDAENSRLKRLREKAISLLNKGASLQDDEISWLKKLARKFRVRENPLQNSQARKELLSKIDIIPSSLTLAQAATESGWGKSRFSSEANNLFGIWTFDKTKGLKPEKRDTEKKHLIRIFEHHGESVAYYMHTLNSHPAYKKLREIRQQSRTNRLAVSGMEMAAGLEKYSARGNDYIQLIRKLIRQNEWAQLDKNNISA